jgi:hypothetical protein
MIAESYLSYPKTAGECGDSSGELLKLPENGWRMWEWYAAVYGTTWKQLEVPQIVPIISSRVISITKVTTKIS